MELFSMTPRQPLPLLQLPLLPGGGAPAGANLLPPTLGHAARHGPLKSCSLHRLEDLQAYLRQCDDQNYLRHYIKVLTSMPHDLLVELKVKLKARSAWLSGEEQREYKRAKLLNVMGSPCAAPSPLRGADADAFCEEVLAGCGGSPPRDATAGAAGAAVAPPLERLEMQLDLRHSFATPAEAPKARPRANVGPCISDPGVAAAGTWAAAACAGARGRQAGSPDEASPPVAAGVTDHQIAEISPDGVHPAAPRTGQQPCTALGAGTLSWQTMLPGK